MRNSSRPEDPFDAAEAVPLHPSQGEDREERAEAKAAFHLRMRARGIQDLGVLRAFELVPRAFFVPQRYRALALRDLALPIGCGQTLLEPWLVGRMIEALDVTRSHRVLEIGSGTGYATAILASLADDVIGLERYRSLAIAAQARLADLAIPNAAIVWGDGLAIPPQVEAFDRIIVHGRLKNVPSRLTNLLAPGGTLVYARAATDANPSQTVVRVEKIAARRSAVQDSAHQDLAHQDLVPMNAAQKPAPREGSDEQALAEHGLTETVVCACRLQAIVTGIAAVL